MTPEKTLLSAEDAVRWFRAQPGNESAVRDNYFDLPVMDAARRYAASEEFAEVKRLLGVGNGRTILDVGAGNGIASYALAEAGWKVTSLEPDPSDEIGAGAIRAIQKASGLPIEIEEKIVVPLPFSDRSFHAIFARQVLHHIPDLFVAMRDFARLLHPGGQFLALREHVADTPAELEEFLSNHPLHALYGQEHAWPLETYLDAARASGLDKVHIWGQLESILNHAPRNEGNRRKIIRKMAERRYGGAGRFLKWWPGFMENTLRTYTATDKTGGRLYSFQMIKPSL